MIDPQDIDPETGRPYPNYSSPSLDTSFHDGEMDVDDEKCRCAYMLTENKNGYILYRCIKCGEKNKKDVS